LSNIIGQRLPETVFMGFNTLKMGVFGVVLAFNFGSIGCMLVVRKLDGVWTRTELSELVISEWITP